MESLYILVHKTLSGIGCTYNIIACLHEVEHIIVEYQSMCNQWNSPMRHLCGRIVPESEHSLIWIIKMLPTNLMMIVFHYIHILSSYQCQINSLAALRYVHQRSLEQLYCGHLPPWQEVCECSKIKLQLLIMWRHNTTSKFSLEYYIAKQPKLVTHYSLIHLSGMVIPINIISGMIIHVASPKTSLIKIQLMFDGRQCDKHCILHFVYDGPSSECRLLQSRISSTHQTLITIGNNTCEGAKQISISKTYTPQLCHKGTYMYNSSGVSAFLHVI